MPHLTLEYSANVTASDNLNELFEQFHGVLSEVGKIDLQNCKSRAYSANNYRVGDGESNRGFIHLDVRFLEGRSAEVISELGSQLLDILKDWFARDVRQLELQITVEIQDICQSRYSKHPEGMFTEQ